MTHFIIALSYAFWRNVTADVYKVMGVNETVRAVQILILNIDSSY